ncbi:MAG: ATP-binding cassette domain-containing protein [Planctomycetota bacterium]
MILRVKKSFEWDGKFTKRIRGVCRIFGLTADRLREHRIDIGCKLKIKAGDIVYITGPSGAGKSVILRELERQAAEEERINLVEADLSCEEAVIDCLDGDLPGALRVLSVAGLSDVFCVLNKVSHLSEGQQWRYRLANALASGKKIIFADEFCCGLDRISAAVVSYRVRRFAKKGGVTFFLASSHEDLLSDLQPDVIVRCDLSGNTEVVYKEERV